MPSTRGYRAETAIRRGQKENARRAWLAELTNGEPRFSGALYVDEAAYVQAIARHRELEREADRILASAE